MCFSQDGQLVAGAGLDQRIRVWSTASGHCVQTLHGHQSTIFSLAISPDHKLLASGTSERFVYLRDVGTGQLLTQLDGHAGGVGALTFSPNGRWLASAGRTLATINWDQALRLIDTKSGECFAVRKTAEMGIHAIAFAPAGEMLAYSGNDFALYLWRWRSDEPPIPLRGHIGKIMTLDFHPTAPILVSGAMDGTLRLWHLPSLASYDHLRPPGPYHLMNIAGVTRLSEAQKAALRTLGAVEE